METNFGWLWDKKILFAQSMSLQKYFVSWHKIYQLPQP